MIRTAFCSAKTQPLRLIEWTWSQASSVMPRKIRLNLVSPGPIDTPLLHRNPGMEPDDVERLKEMMIAHIPMHRMGEADEVAKAVLFLASDEASFITGADLLVDGGLIELS